MKSTISLFLIMYFILNEAHLFSQTTSGQPTSGPGGSDYTHASVTTTNQTSLLTADGYWIFEPASPTPDSADVVIFNHGWGVYNPGPYGAWIEHLVRKGNIVIFPKYEQNDGFFASTYTPNAATGIINAFTELNGSPYHVKPRMNHIAMFGHSFGGVVTANLAKEYTSYGIPPFQCFMLCEAGPATSTGHLSNYNNFDPSYNALIIVGNDDIIVGDTFGNLVFSQAGIPTSHFNFVRQFADQPPIIEATHNEPLAANSNYDGGTIGTIITGGYAASKIDAVDYYCYWKLGDALMSCTFYGTNCNYAFGDTHEQRYMGTWDTGSPVTELQILPSATFINEIQNSSTSIYPNPTQGQIRISTDEKIINIMCYDLLGKLIKSKQYSSTFDVSSLPSGTYILSILTENQQITEKLIKN